jgi:hypothetical protein
MDSYIPLTTYLMAHNDEDESYSRFSAKLENPCQVLRNGFSGMWDLGLKSQFPGNPTCQDLASFREDHRLIQICRIAPTRV